MPLSGTLEDNVLTALCWSEKLAPQIALKLQIADFASPAYRKIAAAALDFLQRHNRPARVHINDLLDSDLRRGGKDADLITQVLDEMETRLGPQLNDDYVLSGLDHWIDVQRLHNALDTASNHLMANDLDKAREALRQPDLLPDESPGVFLRDIDAWLRFRREDDEQDLFTSGLDALDDKAVRPARGELFVLLGASGSGKSWFLINAGKHNLVGGKRVLHITLENSLDITLQRYTQSFLSLTCDEGKAVSVRVFEDPNMSFEGRLRRPENPTRVVPDTPTVESVRELSPRELARRLEPFQRRGQLLIKHYPTSSLTLSMLIGYLDMLELRDGFKPDLLILDYLTLMNLDTRDLRVSIGQLTRNLRGLAGQRNLALVTAVQGNRASRTAKLVTSAHVAEDWSILATSDTFVTYSQTLYEKSRGLARLYVEKARNASDKWLAGLTQSYEIGQFALDSYYFSAALREEFETDEDEDA